MYYSNNDVRVEEMPVPSIKDDEILVKVHASGICGSDVMEWYRKKTAPRVLGHEIAGEIVEIGKDVRGLKIGDRVFVSHHVPCNTCHYCLNGHHTACETLHKTNYDPGGFAEYIRVPRLNVDRGVYKLPDGMSYPTATLIEPLACVLRAQRIAGFARGKSAMVIGTGISGLIHIATANAFGAWPIIGVDINEYRLKAATKFGADHVFHVDQDVRERVMNVNEGRLADMVIICAGSLEASMLGLRCVERGGTVLFFAVPEPGIDIPVPMNEMWRKEIKLMTSYGAAPNDIYLAIRMLSSGRINLDDLITDRLSLDEGQKGFDLVSKPGKSLKVIFEPHRDSI